MIFKTWCDEIGVPLHQLNQTDVVKRLHHLLLIQYILGKLSKNRILREMRIRFFFDYRFYTIFDFLIKYKSDYLLFGYFVVSLQTTNKYKTFKSKQYGAY